MTKKPTYEELERRVKELEKEAIERRQLQEGLRNSLRRERFLGDIIRDASLPIGVGYPDGNLGMCNPAFQKLTGYSEDELKAIDWNTVLTPSEWREQEAAKLEELHRTKHPVSYEKEYLQKDGPRVSVELLVHPQFDKDENVESYFAFVTDITERKRAEELLSASEEKYRSLFESMLNGLAYCKMLYDKDNKPVDWIYLDVNDAFKRITGLTKEIIGKNVTEGIPGIKEDTPELFEIYGKVALTGETKRFEIYLDTLKVWFSVIAYSPRKDYFVAIFEDITDRKQAEKALRQAYNIINRSPTVVFVWKNAEGWPVEFVSDNVVGLFGHTAEEFTSGKVSYAMTVHPDDLKRVAQEVTTYSKEEDRKEFSHDPYRIITKNGEIKWLEDMTSIRRDEKGDITHYEGIVLDISDKKQAEIEKGRLQSQLQQSQKMEAVGTMAGGIAHDFNNILAIILGNAELASADAPDSNPASESLREIHRASIRAKDMVRQLLVFSRKTDEDSKPLNIAPIITESMKMLRSSIPTSVEFKQHISDDSYSVMGDAAQINQIVMNLVINAADAMSEGGGLLEVTLEKIILQEEKACFDWVLSPGPYVRLRMRDTGEGIEPEIMKRIFDPYFTTKEVGKGTGMGLSVIHGIVKRHGGGILVESERGKGTVFEIYFPALEKTEEEEKEPAGEIKGGSERILFVDDEEPMVNLYRRHLERLGYDVKSTTKPVEALEWFKADPDQFDVIITDMTMPRMTGDRLAAEVLKIRPHMPVIICTGYSERMSAKKAEALGVRKYIEKPIDLRNLASSLREVLDEK